MAQGIPNLPAQVADIGNQFTQGVVRGQQVAQSRASMLMQQRQVQSQQRQEDFKRIKVFIETEGNILNDFIEDGNEQGAKDYLEKRKTDPSLSGVFERTGLKNVGVFAFTDDKGKQKVGLEMPLKITEQNIEKFPQDANIQVGDTGFAKMSPDGSKIFSFKRDESATEGGKVAPETKTIIDATLKTGLRELDVLKGLATSQTIDDQQRAVFLDELRSKSDALLGQVKSLLKQNVDVSAPGSDTKIPPKDNDEIIDKAIEMARRFKTLEGALTNLEKNKQIFIDAGVSMEKLKKIVSEAFDVIGSIDSPVPTDIIRDNITEAVRSPNATTQ